MWRQKILVNKDFFPSNYIIWIRGIERKMEPVTKKQRTAEVLAKDSLTGDAGTWKGRSVGMCVGVGVRG